MIEYSRQTGHWRMSPSALAFARSAGRLLCAAETEIKTIVANGALLPMLTLPRSTLERRLPLLKESTGKEYLISAPPAAASTVAPRLAGQLSQKSGQVQSPLPTAAARQMPLFPSWLPCSYRRSAAIPPASDRMRCHYYHRQHV